jgi:hypothetical protein
MSEATDQPAAASGAVVAKQPSFPSPWPLGTGDDVPRFRVRVPALTLEEKGLPRNYQPPPYLRLEVPRRRFRIRLTPRPVLRPTKQSGSYEPKLLVSGSLERTIAGFTDINVSPASQKAFRWYHLVHSSGPVLTTVMSVIGALLVALGALWIQGDLGKGLVIAGIVLTVFSAIGMVVSAWRAPIDGV